MTNSSHHQAMPQADVSSSSSSTEAADLTRRMVCGGVAGMIAKTATNPLDRIRMLSQTGEHGLSGNGNGNGKGGGGGGGGRASASASVSVTQLYRSILSNEGVRGLWAGNGANLLRVFPAKAVVFSSNDWYAGFLRRTFTQTPADQKLHPLWSFLAGGFAGMSATACTYPLDLARGRISGKLARAGISSSSSSCTTTATTATKKEYNGILRTLVITVQDEGLVALYRGVTPTLLGAMPYEGIKFGTVGLLEQWFPPPSLEEGATSTSPLRKMLMGGTGGVMAGMLTYPNDTVRRLLQLQGSRGTSTEYKGYFDCVRKTYQAHGIQRFYAGVTINIVRMAPNAAVQFGAYDLLKKLTAGYF